MPKHEKSTSDERVLDQAIFLLLGLVFIPILSAHVIAVWLKGGVY